MTKELANKKDLKHPLIICFYGGIYDQTGVGKSTASNFIAEKFNFHVCHIGQNIEIVAKQMNYWDGKKDRDGIQILSALCARGRAITPNYWLNMSLLSVPKGTERITFDDIWFVEEYNAIKNMGGYFILIERPGFEQPEWEFDSDFVIHNDGDITAFENKIKQVMGVINRRT